MVELQDVVEEPRIVVLAALVVVVLLLLDRVLEVVVDHLLP